MKFLPGISIVLVVLFLSCATKSNKEECDKGTPYFQALHNDLSGLLFIPDDTCIRNKSYGRLVYNEPMTGFHDYAIYKLIRAENKYILSYDPATGKEAILFDFTHPEDTSNIIMQQVRRPGWEYEAEHVKTYYEKDDTVFLFRYETKMARDQFIKVSWKKGLLGIYYSPPKVD